MGTYHFPFVSFSKNKTMKKITYLIAAAFLFAMGCAQSPSTSPSDGIKVNPAQPFSLSYTPDGNNSHAITDIATPSFTGNSITTGTTSGHKICLSWQSNSPAPSPWIYSRNPTTYSPDPNFAHGWEYWGLTQKTGVGPGTGGHANQPYSGHYELSRLNPDNTTTSLGDITGDSYCDDNLADGTYTYYLKAKSLEGVSPNQKTHHSDQSSGYSVTITSCTEVPIANTYGVGGISGGNGGWNSDGSVWTDGSANDNDNLNFMFTINEWTNTENSCTQVVTPTVVSGGYTGDVYLSIDGGTTWVQPIWGGTYYQSNGNNPGGNGSGLGKPGTGSYTAIYSSTADLSGELGTFTIVIN